MITYYIILLLTLGLMCVILTHPAVSAAGAASGLLVWFNSVLPSLFPFMVLTSLLIRTGLLAMVEQRLRRVPMLRRLPVTACFAVITGLLCGYPMGISSVSELKRNGQLSSRQAKILSAFVNQPGPMFILGYTLPLCGASISASRFLGVFYGGVAVTALTAAGFFTLAGRLSRKIRPDSGQRRQPAEKTELTETKADALSHEPFFSVFERVLMSSMTTLGKIGGYMMLFSLIAALMKTALPGHPLICLIFSGILEMTSGLSLIPASGGRFSACLALGFVSFGGLSVAAQSFSLGKLSTGEQLQYLTWKIIQSAVTAGLWLLLDCG